MSGSVNRVLLVNMRDIGNVPDELLIMLTHEGAPSYLQRGGSAARYHVADYLDDTGLDGVLSRWGSGAIMVRMGVEK